MRTPKKRKSRQKRKSALVVQDIGGECDTHGESGIRSLIDIRRSSMSAVSYMGKRVSVLFVKGE